MLSHFYKFGSIVLVCTALSMALAFAQPPPPSTVAMSLVDPLQLAYAATHPVAVRFDFSNVANPVRLKFTNSLASFGSIQDVTESKVRPFGAAIQTVGAVRLVHCDDPDHPGKKAVSYRVNDSTGELVMFVGDSERNSALQLPPAAICPVMLVNLLSPSQQPFTVRAKWTTPVNFILRSSVITVPYSVPALPSTVMSTGSELTMKFANTIVTESTLNQLIYKYTTNNFSGIVYVDFKDSEGDGIVFEDQPWDQMQCRSEDETGAVIATITATSTPGRFAITSNQNYNSSAQEVYCSWQLPSRGLSIANVVRQTASSPTTVYTQFTKQVLLEENTFTALFDGYNRSGVDDEVPTHLKVYFAAFPEANDYFDLQFVADSPSDIFPVIVLDLPNLATSCGPNTSAVLDALSYRIRVYWTATTTLSGPRQFECAFPLNDSFTKISELNLANADRQIATTVSLSLFRSAFSGTDQFISRAYNDYNHPIYQPKQPLAVQYNGATFPLATIQSTPTSSLTLSYQFSITRAKAIASQNLAFSLQITGGQVAVPVESYPGLFQCHVPGSPSTSIPITYDQYSLEWFGAVHQTSFAAATSTLAVVCEVTGYPLVQSSGMLVYPHSIPQLQVTVLDLGPLVPGSEYLSKSFRGSSTYALPTTPAHFGLTSFGTPTTPVIPQLTVNMEVQILDEAALFTTIPTTTYDGMIDDIHDVIMQPLIKFKGPTFAAQVMNNVLRTFTIHGLTQSTSTMVSSLTNTERIESRMLETGSAPWSTVYEGMNDYQDSSRQRVLSLAISYQLSSNIQLLNDKNQLQYLQHAVDQIMLNTAPLMGKYQIVALSSNQSNIRKPTACGLKNGTVYSATSPYDVVGVNYCDIGQPCVANGDCQNNSPFEGFPVCSSGICTVASFRDNRLYRNVNFVATKTWNLRSLALYNNNDPLNPNFIYPSDDSLAPYVLHFPADHLLVNFDIINFEIISESWYDSGRIQLVVRLHKALSDSFYAVPLTIQSRSEGAGYWTFTATVSLLEYPELTANWGTAPTSSAFVQVDFILYSAEPTDPNRKIVSVDTFRSDLFKMSYQTYRPVVEYTPLTCPTCPAPPSTQTLVVSECWDDSVTPSVQVQELLCHAQPPPAVLSCSCD